MTEIKNKGALSPTESACHCQRAKNCQGGTVAGTKSSKRLKGNDLLMWKAGEM